MPCLISCHVSMPTWLSLSFHFSFGTKKQNKTKKEEKRFKNTCQATCSVSPEEDNGRIPQRWKSLLIFRSVSYTRCNTACLKCLFKTHNQLQYHKLVQSKHHNQPGTAIPKPFTHLGCTPGCSFLAGAQTAFSNFCSFNWKGLSHCLFEEYLSPELYWKPFIISHKYWSCRDKRALPCKFSACLSHELLSTWKIQISEQSVRAAEPHPTQQDSLDIHVASAHFTAFASKRQPG